MGYNNGSWGLGSKGGGSGGSGGTTGWEDMLAQNQAQAADHSINLNGFNVQFADGNIDVLGTLGDLTNGTWQINNDGSVFFGDNKHEGWGLLLDNSGISAIGDYNGRIGAPYLSLNANTLTQYFNANNGFQFTGANYPNGFASINPNTRQVYIGDYATTQSDNGTYLLVDDGNSFIATQYNGLPLGMKLDFGAQKYWIGNAGGTYAQIDDNFGIGSQTFNADYGFQFTGVTYPNGFASINPSTAQILLGDYNYTFSNTYLDIDDGTENINAYSGSINLNLPNGSPSDKIEFNSQLGNYTFIFRGIDGSLYSKGDAYGDGLFTVQYDNNTGGAYAALGDWNNNNQNTHIILDDNHAIWLANCVNGFTFTGGSTISSDGDLSLMGGYAGIFDFGCVSGYNTTYNSASLYTSGAGDFYIQNSGAGGVGGVGQTTLWLNENGNFQILDNGSIYGGNNSLSTNGLGQFFIGDVTNNGSMTLYVDKYGLQTVDAIAGFGAMSPSWLLGTVTTGVPTLTTPSYINVNIGGVPTQIPCFQ